MGAVGDAATGLATPAGGGAATGRPSVPGAAETGGLATTGPTGGRAAIAGGAWGGAATMGEPGRCIDGGAAITAEA